MNLIACSQRRRGAWSLVVVAAGLAALFAVLATFLELPLERNLKGLVGIDYDAPCGQLRHHGAPGPWRAETPLPHVREQAVAACRRPAHVHRLAARRSRHAVRIPRSDLDPLWGRSSPAASLA